MSLQTGEIDYKPPPTTKRGLRLLSYNIQAGIDTRHYREYVTKGWKHLLPSRERVRNLNLIAEMLHCRPQESRPLTQVLMAKTAGNPFFLTRLLQTVTSNGLLHDLEGYEPSAL